METQEQMKRALQGKGQTPTCAATEFRRSSCCGTRIQYLVKVTADKRRKSVLHKTGDVLMVEGRPLPPLLNIVRNGTIKIGDLSFEEVEKFKYLGATVTNINDTREEMKRRINMGNACYYSVEKLLSSSLLSKNLKVRIYKTVILPVVLYGCETWTLTLREEHRLRVFENKVLRKIFGAKRDEVTGEWRKLHNTELHALYSSPDIIRTITSRRLRWAGHLARMGESRNAYRVLVGRPEGKRPLRRPRRRWEDNIKMELREVGYDGRDWINLAQDRDQWRAYVRAAMNLRGASQTPELFSLSHMRAGARRAMNAEGSNVQKPTRQICGRKVRAVKIELNSLPGSEVQVLRDKFQNRFGKNSGYKKMCKVAQVLEDVPVGKIDSVCVFDIPLFKYARLTSCDVERSFSQYKSLFRDNRHAFVIENLEMNFVVHCNSRPTTSTQVWLRAYGDVCMGGSSVRRWVKHIGDGNTSIQDEPRSGRPRTASTERNKERVDEFWDAFWLNFLNLDRP
ncbi:hypothetical protein ANN_07195 [Periplaneta americana]|uniref:Uncharacterized protein n=1 Tax=Periplaneta americana TaxID=6978 RepID=A0ABQ8TFU1_PERAM|nr:hypothetical protein ANN_07195 [Periplaneta americana]